jgi:hypothetical protein
MQKLTAGKAFSICIKWQYSIDLMLYNSYNKQEQKAESVSLKQSKL